MFQKHLGDRAKEHKAFDIANWQKTWLEEAGMNSVKATWQAGSESITLTQEACLQEYPTLRFHRIDVGFLDADGKLIKVEEAILENTSETKLAISGGVPANTVAVIPNYNDYSFIKIIFDDASQHWFEDNLQKVQEPLSQGLVLRGLFEGVRDARYRISSFIKMCTNTIRASQSNQIVDLCYTLLSRSINFLPEAQIEENYHALYKVTREKLVASTCPQFDLSLAERLLSYGFHLDDVLDLKSLLESKNEDLKKVALSIDDKWKIVTMVNAHEGVSREEAKLAFDTLYAADDSDSKKNSKLTIDALNASVEERTSLLEEYFNKDTKWSYVEVDHSIHGFCSHFKSLEVRRPYFSIFFERIIETMRIRSRQYAEVRFEKYVNGIDYLGRAVPIHR